jgi:hypothetical protein
MISIGFSELILISVIIVVFIVFLHYLLGKKVEEVEDSKRIRDLMIIGLLLFSIGTYYGDNPLIRAGQAVFGYGFLLLLYKNYKKGLEEGYRDRKGDDL